MKLAQQAQSFPQQPNGSVRFMPRGAASGASGIVVQKGNVSLWLVTYVFQV